MALLAAFHPVCGVCSPVQLSWEGGLTLTSQRWSCLAGWMKHGTDQQRMLARPWSWMSVRSCLTSTGRAILGGSCTCTGQSAGQTFGGKLLCKQFDGCFDHSIWFDLQWIGGHDFVGKFFHVETCTNLDLLITQSYPFSWTYHFEDPPNSQLHTNQTDMHECTCGSRKSLADETSTT